MSRLFLVGIWNLAQWRSVFRVSSAGVPFKPSEKGVPSKKTQPFGFGGTFVKDHCGTTNGSQSVLIGAALCETNPYLSDNFFQPLEFIFSFFVKGEGTRLFFGGHHLPNLGPTVHHEPTVCFPLVLSGWIPTRVVFFFYNQ